MDGAFRFPFVILGKILLSCDPEFVNTNDAAHAVYDRARIIAAAHSARATRVIRAFGMLLDKIIQCIIGLHRIAGLDFTFYEWLKSFLSENFTCQTDTVPEIYPILFERHIVEKDFWSLSSVFGCQCYGTSGFRAHWPHVGLKSVSFCGDLTVVANGDWQEMVLNVRIRHARFRAGKARTFKLV